MSKKHFIALADAIMKHDAAAISERDLSQLFTRKHIETLAAFCKAQNNNFNEERWITYLAGDCGPNGGAR